MAYNVVISIRPPRFSGTKDDDAISHWLAFLDYVLELDINKSYNLSQDRVFK